MTISNDTVVKTGFVGLGIENTYTFDELTGFKTSLLRSRGGTYEYLYLMIDDRKVVKISEYYHKNYKELKRFLINKKLKNLGNEYWSLIRETKEIFQ